jgi:hypothetical protein
VAPGFYIVVPDDDHIVVPQELIGKCIKINGCPDDDYDRDRGYRKTTPFYNRWIGVHFI